jgi:phosphoglycolate phosphatase-like HAD superfamily hydrolase
MRNSGIIARCLLLGAVLAAPVVAAAAPWDSACTDALTDVAGALASAQAAQHDVQERYERFAQQVKGYNSCRLFPEVYDVLRDGCEQKRSVTEAARSEAEKSLSAFTARFRGLYDTINAIAVRCGNERGAKDSPPKSRN